MTRNTTDCTKRIPARSARVKIALAVLLILTTLSAAACSPKPKPVELADSDLEARAETLITLLSDSEDMSADVVEMFSSQMARSVPTETVKELWPGLVSQFGEYKGQRSVSVTGEAGYKTVYVTCAFETGNVNCKVVFDKAGLVAGLWIVPIESETSEYTPPEYADARSFTETQVTIGQGEWQLPGLLAVPEGDGPFPAVVLVHGSGPNDMDETIGPNKPFKDLAGGLASQGIAVLRYEKRTYEHQARMTQLTPSITVHEETIEDAALAVSLLRSDACIDPDRVFVLGHSLGGMLSPRIAAESQPAGLVMLAANARSLPDLVEEQLNYLATVDGTVSAEEASQIASVKAACDKIRAGQLEKSEVVLGAGSAYWADLMAYDPVAMAQSMELPMLFLQGERDYQVTMTDFGLWQESLKDSSDRTFKSYPTLNHLFIAGTGKSVPAEYEVPGHVDEEVVDDIAQWIKNQ